MSERCDTGVRRRKNTDQCGCGEMGGSGGSLAEKAVCVRTAGEVDVRGDAGEALDRAKGLDGPALE